MSTLLLAASCSASLHGVVSTQYHNQDTLGQYSYGYAEPNSQKQEVRLANGVTTGSYSYVDGHGLVQSVKYASDPVHGFQVAGTNLPVGPAPVVAHAAPLAYAHHAAPLATYAHAAPIAHSVIAPAAVTPLSYTAHGLVSSGSHSALASPLIHHLHKRAASWGAPAYNQWSHGAQAPAPVIHNGVPVETPEVQAAKAAHFAAVARAQAADPENHYNSGHSGHYAPAPQHYAPAPQYAPVPQIHNGVPVETPEVQAAKAAHLAALAQAESHARANPSHHGGYNAPVHYAPAHGDNRFHIPVIQNGVPVETPEVQQAKAAHLAAVSQAQAHSGPSHGQWGGHHY